MPPYTEPAHERVSQAIRDLETASARMFAKLIERLDELESRDADLDGRVVDIEGYIFPHNKTRQLVRQG